MSWLLHELQRMPAPTARKCAARAASHPAADPGVDYPGWYLKRWHCLPEGYLSHRSARLYDRTFRRIYAAFREDRMFEAVQRVVPEQGSVALLEVGCGTGRLLETARSRLPHVRLSGVDLSPYMVASAASRTGLPVLTPGSAAAGVEGIVHADASDLPWPDASFDVIAAAHVLGHVPEEVAAALLDEFRRVLRAGGRAVLAEHSWHRLPAGPLGVAREERIAGGMIRLLTLMADGGAPRLRS